MKAEIELTEITLDLSTVYMNTSYSKQGFYKVTVSNDAINPLVFVYFDGLSPYTILGNTFNYIKEIEEQTVKDTYRTVSEELHLKSLALIMNKGDYQKIVR